MASWSEGYFTDVAYTDHYFRELNPLWLNFNLTLAGLDIPGFAENGDICPPKDFHYLELAFGQGRSINIHAHASSGTFVGTDFNPTQTLNARSWIRSSNVTLYDESFKQLLERFDREKPQFDYIVFHGLFSWINEENRKIIMEIISKYLKVGGVVYNSYNCFPGWSPKIPTRTILKLYNETHNSAEIDTKTSVQNGISFLGEFLDTNPAFMVANPHNKALFDGLKTQDPNYIAHEYLNSSWDFFFSDIAKLFEESKCTYATSANLLDHFWEFNLTREAHTFLNKIQDRIFKEQLRDYYINTQFRKDIFIKGAKAITMQQQRQRILRTHFVLLLPPESFKPTIKAPLGEANLNKEMYESALNHFKKDDYTPKTLQSLMDSCKIDFNNCLQIAVILTHQNFISPAQEMDQDLKARARAYNSNLFYNQTQGDSSAYVVAPRIHSCIGVSNLEQIAMYGFLTQNLHKETELVNWTIKTMKDNGQGFIKDGKVIEKDSEVREEIKKLIKAFLEKIPIYKALGILDSHQ